MAIYSLFGQKIELADSAERFFDIQQSAWDAIDVASESFGNWYGNCGDILAVLKGYEEITHKLVAECAVNPLFDNLTTLEIYDISRKHWQEICYDDSKSVDAFNEVAEVYNSIVEQQEAEMEYRSARKDSRGRVVGGGFGVSGAIKGIATAGAINAISGAGHGIFNAIGNAGSAISAASSKRDLYKNAQSVLKSAIAGEIAEVYSAYIRLVNERKNGYYKSTFDRDKADALFESAQKVQNKRQELIVEAFRNCPWKTELLVYILKEYEQERKNVWTIAKRFSVDLSEAVEELFASFYETCDVSSEVAIHSCRNKILRVMGELGIENSQTINRLEINAMTCIFKGYDDCSESQKQDLLNRLDQYDAAAHNKGKFIHDNGVWELAKKYGVRYTAVESERIIAKVYSESAKSDEGMAQKAKKQIASIMLALDVKESKTLDTLETDCLMRLVKGYETADEAECEKMIQQVEQYDAQIKIKKLFASKLSMRLEEIWSAEDGEIFDDLYLKTNLRDADQIQAAITCIREKGRTENAQSYIKALSHCNENTIAMAHKYQKPIAKISLICGLLLVALGTLLWILEFGLLVGILVGAIGVVFLTYYFKLYDNWNTLTLNGHLIHREIALDGIEKRIK